MSNRYSVPKHKARVTIRVAHQPSETAYLFLGTQSAAHMGRERPSDVLNNPDEFVTVENERGEIQLLRCSSVSIVTVNPEDEIDKDPVLAEPMVPDLDTVVRVAVTLEDGNVLEATARYQLPEQACRLLDWLNGPERFLRLHADDDVLLVNKRKIVCVTPV